MSSHGYADCLLPMSGGSSNGPGATGSQGLITISLRVLLKAGCEVYTGYKTALI